MKKRYLLALPLLLVIAYLLGPQPDSVDFNTDLPVLSLESEELEDSINRSEARVKQLKPDNEARIIWFDSTKKEKTPFSMVYLHGFSASQGEAYPVHRNLAKKFGANLYLSRLAEHGVYGDSVFKTLTPEALMGSAKHAVSVGKQIGDSVIIVATSTGAAYGLYIASEHPEIKALVCYSPIIDFYDPNAFVITKPWGREIMKMIVGSDFRDNSETKKMDQYWTTSYMIDGVIDLKVLVEETMVKETFEKVKCPVFLGYYYKNDSLQDQVVSVPAMLKMFDQLGTPDNLKEKVAFPEAGRHVIASELKSGDFQGVELATVNFLSKIITIRDTLSVNSSEEIGNTD